MTAPTVAPGLGTTLKITVSAALTAVTNVTNIDGPNWTVGSQTTTHLLSTAVTSRPTLPDGGEITFDIWYLPSDATHGALLALMAAPAIIACKLIFADDGDAEWAFNAYPTSFKPGGMTPEDNLTASITLKINGVPTATT